jgi:hypothetical protein
MDTKDPNVKYIAEGSFGCVFSSKIRRRENNEIVSKGNKKCVSKVSVVKINPIFMKNTPNKKRHLVFYILRKPRNQRDCFFYLTHIFRFKKIYEKISANKILAF